MFIVLQNRPPKRNTRLPYWQHKNVLNIPGPAPLIPKPKINQRRFNSRTLSSLTPAHPVASASVGPATKIPMTVQEAKFKCRNFLSTLLRLASEQPISVTNFVKELIQELVDAQVGTETFVTKLTAKLNSSPQPCLLPFLNVSSTTLFIANVNLFHFYFFVRKLCPFLDQRWLPVSSRLKAFARRFC